MVLTATKSEVLGKIVEVNVCESHSIVVAYA